MHVVKGFIRTSVFHCTQILPNEQHHRYAHDCSVEVRFPLSFIPNPYPLYSYEQEHPFHRFECQLHWSEQP